MILSFMLKDYNSPFSVLSLYLHRFAEVRNLHSLIATLVQSFLEILLRLRLAVDEENLFRRRLS